MDIFFWFNLAFQKDHKLSGHNNYHKKSRDTTPQCLKIIEKVSFNIASEASYVYILRGLKMIKNAKNGQNMMLEVKQWYQAGQY